jgi:hypothetical protein
MPPPASHCKWVFFFFFYQKKRKKIENNKASFGSGIRPMEKNSYSHGIAIPLRRGIGIPLKKEWNTYFFPVGINKIHLLPKSPNPLNTQVSYPSLSVSQLMVCLDTKF